MTQSDFGTIDPATKSGTTLASDLNGFRNALNTNHAGVTRPSYVQAGMTWLDTSAAPVYYLKLYDGTDDIVLNRINITSNIGDAPNTRQEVIKTGAYTVVAADAYVALVNNAASAVTYTLPAVGASKNELYFIKNISAFPLTIDPNGAELIEGVSAITLRPSDSIWIWPDGTTSVWHASVVRGDLNANPVWEKIADDAVSGVTSYILTNLSAFRKIRITGLIVTAAGPSNFFLRTSTNNGSSYDSGSSDYNNTTLSVQSTTLASLNSLDAQINLMNSGTIPAGSPLQFNFLAEAFNKPQAMLYLNNCIGSNASGAVIGQMGGYRNSAVARNALQIASSQAFTGSITVEGIRG